MATCPNGHQVRAGTVYCGVCGADTRVLCNSGHFSPTGSKFCQVCGMDLRGNAAPGVASVATNDTMLVVNPTETSPVAPPETTSGLGSDRSPSNALADEASQDETARVSAPESDVAMGERSGEEHGATTLVPPTPADPVSEPSTADAGSSGFGSGVNAERSGNLRPDDPGPFEEDGSDDDIDSTGGRGHGLIIGVLAAAAVVIAGVVLALVLGGHSTPQPVAQVVPNQPRGTSSTTAVPQTTTSSVSTTTTTATPAISVGPGGWTYPTPIDQSGQDGSNQTINAISCPTSYNCYAVDQSGNILQSSNEGAWQVVDTDKSDGLNAISCPSVSFCAAVDSGGNAVLLTNGSWSDPIAIDSNQSLNGVSCASTTFCVAVDGAGNAITYTGSSTNWATAMAGQNQLTAVSCPSASFCEAADDNGNASTFNGSSWSTAVQVDQNSSLHELSCISLSFCSATDDNGTVYTYNGSSWDGGDMLLQNASHSIPISCPAAGYCVAVDGSGGVRVLSDGTWSPVLQIDGNNSFSAISCSGPNMCAATDNNNNVLYYQPKSGG